MTVITIIVGAIGMVFKVLEKSKTVHQRKNRERPDNKIRLNT